jgi:hypothetical protein
MGVFQSLLENFRNGLLIGKEAGWKEEDCSWWGIFLDPQSHINYSSSPQGVVDFFFSNVIRTVHLEKLEERILKVFTTKNDQCFRK